MIFLLVFHQSKCVYHHQFPDTRWPCRLSTTDHGLWLWSCYLYGTSLQFRICTNYRLNLYLIRIIEHLKLRFFFLKYKECNDFENTSSNFYFLQTSKWLPTSIRPKQVVTPFTVQLEHEQTTEIKSSKIEITKKGASI